MKKEYIVQSTHLKQFTKSIFQKTGVPAQEATDAADVLVWADLHGVNTHGVRNLKEIYITPLEKKQLKCASLFQIDQETPISARVNAGRGLGLSAACQGMQLAIAKARESGAGFVSMHSSHHLGAAGYFSMMAANQNMIGISMTGFFLPQGSDKGVLPTFGLAPMLSTNPLSIAFPTGNKPTFLLDMATSKVPYNRVQMMMQEGQSIPLGWGLDQKGQPTTDPAAVHYLLPLGGSREQGGHKGYGLALMVQVLCAVLSGGWSNDEQTQTSGTSPSPTSHFFHSGQNDNTSADKKNWRQKDDAHFFGAIRIDTFRPLEKFKESMDAMIQAIQSSPPSPEQERVYFPGEIEAETQKRRLAEGIPLSKQVVDDLLFLSSKYAIPLILQKV